ncbi:TonB-linked outer membrane protein, SusC/RagA family [Pedobacter steynii]|uniref:TonB-linked outer membrane protein, SusC/RagA family n=1 Tax=Pedobacter steynii TaxID=430522 RepID=A0A1G9NIZ9_9SPHI|nr:TonB-dependent receptor [Pedobacter steynii]NQX39298.1 TonB-dependent receptor [Pedobacter steynii]SDL85977.1 TonB-linked outer membrane protein, SusC/RagA family [Pedobacter steynii]
MNKIFTRFLTGLVTVQIVASGFHAYGNAHFVPGKTGGLEIPKNIFFKPIKGKITDEKGLGLPGATVTVKGTKRAVGTDSKGQFSIEANAGDVLLVTFTGYVTAEIRISSQENVSLMLKEDNSELNEVVVVGFGQQKKISVTAAISTVSSKDLKQSPVANLSNAMMGRLPGLIGQQTSGDPGRDAATLLIRGQGTYNNASPLVLVDGIERSFNTIDPNEVENISILKDASATAVYGVRGANGVILVTTRRGALGKTVVNITGNNAIQEPTRLPNYLDAYNYSLLLNEAYANEGKGAFFAYSQTDLEGYKNHTDPYLYPDVDYMKEFLKPVAQQYTINANVSGGTKIAKYFVSGSYFSQDGLYKHTGTDENAFNGDLNYNRYNFRSNVDLDVTPSLRISANFAARAETRNGPASSTSTLFSSLVAFPPNSAPLTNPDGTYGYNFRQANVLAQFRSGFSKEYNNKLEGTVVLDYKLTSLLKGLSFKTNLSFTNEYIHTITRSYADYLKYKILGKNPDGTYIYSEAAGAYNPTLGFSQAFDPDVARTAYVEAGLNYTNSFGKNTVTGLILANRSRKIRNNAAYDWPFSYQGIVGRVTYNYDDRYFAEANLGYNGSENFPTDKKYGLFPSISAGWVLSNEAFLKPVKWISLLKFRGSYGQVGNDKYGEETNATDRFLFIQNSFTTGSGYSFGLTNNNAVAGFTEGAFGNPIVTWEKANKANIGLESTFFNNKITLNADVFYDKRNNILTRYGNIPATFGQTSPIVNLGTVENKGYELELGYNNKINSFGYTIKANFNYARNKIIFRDEPQTKYPWMRRTGQAIRQLWGYQTAGFFNSEAEIEGWAKTTFDPGPLGKLQPGDFKYVDQNGDGLIDIYDQVPIGNPTTPVLTFGGTIGFNYKNFDFSLLIQGAGKTSMRRTLEAAYEFFNKGKVMDLHLGRWTPATAATATYPRLSSSPSAGQHNYVDNDFFLIDAGYLRIKSAELGYTLPNGWIEKIGLKNARIYASGFNLYTWDKIDYLDPENRDLRAWYYPQQRIFNFGASVSF